MTLPRTLPPLEETNLPQKNVWGPEGYLGNCQTHFFWWMMLVYHLVQLKWKMMIPSPNAPAVRYVFIEGKGAPFPRLRSRKQTQNPLPWEEPGGSGRRDRLLCLQYPRIWPGISPCPGGQAHAVPELLILSVMSSGLALSTDTE